MQAKKIHLAEASTQLLKTLKFRTGLTHQYTCRIAFCLSLTEAEPLEPADYDEKGLEFNRYTLTGEHDTLLVAYLNEWLCSESTAESHPPEAWFRAHINRGLRLLVRRVKSLPDIVALVPGA